MVSEQEWLTYGRVAVVSSPSLAPSMAMVTNCVPWITNIQLYIETGMAVLTSAIRDVAITIPHFSSLLLEKKKTFVPSYNNSA
jgi:hypothetical protein